jgi:hypothetical protein
MPSITMPPQEAREIIWDESPVYETRQKIIVDTSRWAIQYEQVCEHVPSGRCFRFYYQVGATEYQDERPFEYDKEVIAVEVRPVEKRVTVYEPVKEVPNDQV